MSGRVPDAGAGRRARWNARIARARALAGESSSAGQLLTFYAALAERQRDLLESRPNPVAADDRAFRDALDLEPALAAIPKFLSWLTSQGPTSLAESAGTLQRLDAAEWLEAMRVHVADEADPVDDAQHAIEFVVAAVLQPLAEDLAVARGVPSRAGDEPVCPVCGGAPVVGVLREEGHGGRRALVCSFCLTEHGYRRVVCPACREQRFEALPVFRSDTFAHVRIDACDTCRTYIKTIDMTKDGLADPVVDDIATVTLDLWARERGYQRLRENLLRL